MIDTWVLPEPWEGISPRAWASVKKCVAHDAAALLLIAPKRPAAADLLASRGVMAKHVEAWLSACSQGDPLLKQAARGGITTMQTVSTPPAAALPTGMHTVAAAERCAPGSDRYWALALGRKKKAFSADEQARVQLLVSLIRQRFETPPPGEPGTRRLLASPDGRIMHADVQLRLSAPGGLEAGGLQPLFDDLRAMESQRWPGKPEAKPRDLFPVTNGRPPLWTRLFHLPIPGARAGGAIALSLRPIHGIAPPPAGLVPDDRIAQAIGVLTDSYADAPPLNDLAARFDVSPFHFQRLFTAQAGVSPKHLVLRVQLLHARWRLRTTMDPIQQIAAGCGFSSHGHFTATFHRMVGVTPLDYRLGIAPPDGLDR